MRYRNNKNNVAKANLILEEVDEYCGIPDKYWDEEQYWADRHEEMRLRELHEMGVEL